MDGSIFDRLTRTLTLASSRRSSSSSVRVISGCSTRSRGSAISSSRSEVVLVGKVPDALREPVVLVGKLLPSITHRPRIDG